MDAESVCTHSSWSNLVAEGFILTSIKTNTCDTCIFILLPFISFIWSFIRWFSLPSSDLEHFMLVIKIFVSVQRVPPTDAKETPTQIAIYLLWPMFFFPCTRLSHYTGSRAASLSTGQFCTERLRMIIWTVTPPASYRQLAPNQRSQPWSWRWRHSGPKPRVSDWSWWEQLQLQFWPCLTRGPRTGTGSPWTGPPHHPPESKNTKTSRRCQTDSQWIKASPSVIKNEGETFLKRVVFYTLKPRSSRKLATLLEYSSSCRKVHLSPVPSKMSAVLSPWRCTVSAKILGMVFFSLTWRLTFIFTRNKTYAALRKKKKTLLKQEHRQIKPR